MKRFSISCFIFLSLFSEAQAVIKLSSAISLTEFLHASKKILNEEGVEINLGFASSGILAQQILHGAPIDIFISANQEWIKKLVEEGVVEEESVKEIFRNEIVLVSHKQHTEFEELQDLFKVKQKRRIVIGDPAFVPVGKYTVEYLNEKDLYHFLKPAFVYASHAKQALSYVENEYADFGFVYHSDALGSENIYILQELEHLQKYKGVSYFIAVMKKSSGGDVRKTYQFFLSEEAIMIANTFGLHR